MAESKITLMKDTPFEIVESYKTLRTNLLFTLAGGNNKTVVISSALPAEGKSLTCANLSAVMAQTESKVILIDADLRRPVQSQIFQRDNVRGLSTILAGFDDFGAAIKKDAIPNLDIITSGPIPPNPSELLGSEKMKNLLNDLQGYYDYILMDTPPINLVADAMVLSNKTAGVVLVARHGQSTFRELTKAITNLEFSGANILGLILNAKKGKSGGYYKYGKYSYN